MSSSRGDRRKYASEYKRPQNNTSSKNLREQSSINQRLKPVKPREMTLQYLLETFQTKWHRWSPTKKIFYASLFLVGCGFSAAIAQQLLYSIIIHFDVIFGNNSASNNANIATSSAKVPVSHQAKASLPTQLPHGNNINKAATIEKVGIFATSQKARPIKVICEPNMCDFFSKKYPADFKFIKTNIDQQAILIKKLLPQVMPKQLLNELSQDPTFSIQITQGRTQLMRNAVGRYMPEENTIFIVWDMIPNEQELILALRNEFHHAFVRYCNSQKIMSGSPIFDWVYPFLDKDGNIDSAQADALDAAIKQADARFARFHQLYQAAQLAPAEQEELLNYQKIIANFSSLVTRVAKDASTLASELASGSLIKLNGENLYMYPAATNEGQEYDFYVFQEYESDNKIMFKGRFAKDDSLEERTKAFFAATIASPKRYNTLSTYSSQHLNRDEINTEISSDLQMLDIEIRQGFCKEWEDYFKAYYSSAKHHRPSLNH